MPPMQSVLSEPIAIIGAGVAGLINAHVLLQDGFTDVTLISRDTTVGGVWARERVYPGLHINNVHGEYRFSSLDMPPPEFEPTMRLTGNTMCEYMETFSRKFLQGKAKFRLKTEVLNIERIQGTGSPWRIKVESLGSGSIETLEFNRIILATGGCSNPKIPIGLSPNAAQAAGFKGLVFHTSEFGSRLDDVLSLVNPVQSDNLADEQDTVVVIGGGKSAQDVCAKLANEGRKVAIVFETTDIFLASPKPMPDALRKSRFLSTLMAHSTLRTRWERFLHTTWLGARLVHLILRSITSSSFKTFNIPSSSPLCRTHSMFWGVRLNDETGSRSDSYHSLVMDNRIRVFAPARAVGYSPDGKSILLNNGSSLPAKVVILGTGYESSWSKVFTKEVAEDIGLARHPPTRELVNDWNYESLKDGPVPPVNNQNWVTSIYRGIVPAKNILRRDFAIAGALFTANPGYTNEVVAHWISSYFQRDKMRIPTTSEDALAFSERQSSWMRVRFPEMLSWANESYSGSLDFWTWPQAVDEMLEDMYLPSQRSGGNWLSWIFKTIKIEEIQNLAEERRALRLKQVD